jgi:AcrR family transcriptional regulator
MPDPSPVQSEADDRRAQRRAARRADNRAEILDAAEKVFGADGLRAGSLRKIAAESGFSTAAIYLFFDNKQHLLAETMRRRGDELLAAVRAAADSDLEPMEALHRIVDDTVAFFESRPAFRQLLRHIRGGPTITGPVLESYADGGPTFDEVMAVIAAVVTEGQQRGEIRDGDARALAHLYSVLINEFVLLAASGAAHNGSLTPAQFHSLIDGALRLPTIDRSDIEPGARS